MSSKRSSAAKKAADQKAETPKADETQPKASSLADVAPLEPPTDDESADEQPVTEDAPEATQEPEQPAEAPKDSDTADEAQQEPVDSGQGDAGQDGDQGGDQADESDDDVTVQPTPTGAPAAATLEPPVEKKQETQRWLPPRREDTVADKLRNVTQQLLVVTDVEGNSPDPEAVFTRHSRNVQVANMRLHRHGTATKHERPITVLLLAKGSTVSDVTAERIKAQLRRQQEQIAAEADAAEADAGAGDTDESETSD